MIGFFRKIRKQLADDNKPLKYARYAIGEIVLVVIGILIAIQVNNWNEDRKLEAIEIETLKDLRSDLIQSLNDIKGDQKYFQNCKKSTQIILDHIDYNLPYEDSLSYHFANMYPFPTFSINRTTFDNLRQSGFRVISNDSLIKNISNFYTRTINLYKELEKRAVIEHDENYIKPMKISEFSSYSNQSLIIRDYKKFISNPDNKQILNFSMFIFDGLVNYQNYLIKVIQNLIIDIDKEVAYYGMN